MTPTMSLLLVCGLVAGLTLARLPGRLNLRNLPASSKRAAVLVHLSVCGLGGLLVWVFTVSVGTPLTDYLGVLGLLVLESLLAGVLSCLVLFGQLSLHKSSGIKENIKKYFQEIKDRNRKKTQEEPEGMTRLETTQKQLPPGMKVIYSSGKGRWTADDRDRTLDEEPNSRIG